MYFGTLLTKHFLGEFFWSSTVTKEIHNSRTKERSGGETLKFNLLLPSWLLKCWVFLLSDDFFKERQKFEQFYWTREYKKNLHLCTHLYFMKKLFSSTKRFSSWNAARRRMKNSLDSNTLFENHRKSLIQHCERSELLLHFEWTKVNKKCHFGEFLKI